MLKAVDGFLAKVEKVLLVGLFSALIILMTVNIVQRNLLGQSSQEILEYMPSMVLWISLLGASLALRQQKHICMELVLRFVPARYKPTIHRLSGAFGMVVMIIGLILATDFMAGELKIFGARGYISSIIPGFFVLAIFRYFVWLIHPEQNTDHP